MPVHRRNDVWKKAMHAGTTNLHPDFGPPSYGIPYDVVGGGHAKVSIDFTYADESDPGPYPFGPDITIEGGSDRHALMVDQSDCTLYELYAARWNGGNAEGRQRRDLRPRLERPAAARLDERRRGRPADLRGAAALGRGAGRRRRPRDPVHGRLHVALVPVAGAAPGGLLGRPLPADGRAVPAEARVLARGVQRRREDDPPRDEALRPGARGQRQRLVLPGHARPGLDERRCSTS